jgi:hypothetical protein
VKIKVTYSVVASIEPWQLAHFGKDYEDVTFESLMDTYAEGTLSVEVLGSTDKTKPDVDWRSGEDQSVSEKGEIP